MTTKMTTNPTLELHHPLFEGRIGIARREITPPEGISTRNWACAAHNTAEGIDRSLWATVFSFASLDGGDPSVLMALDGGWWRGADTEWFVRGAILDALGLDGSRLMINLSHTHAGPALSLHLKDKPGGDRLEPYLAQIRSSLIQATCQAIETADRATLSWTTGRCDLARNRDLANPVGGRMLCGFNPDGPADDTLLIGRVTDMAAGLAECWSTMPVMPRPSASGIG